MKADIVSSDYLEYKSDKASVLFLCPPWGGVKYLRRSNFDLMVHLTPNLYDILEKALTLSNNIVI